MFDTDGEALTNAPAPLLLKVKSKAPNEKIPDMEVKTPDAGNVLLADKEMTLEELIVTFTGPLEDGNSTPVVIALVPS
jgi:hypothetical protein